MSVTYGFFDSVNGDRKYNASTMSEFYTGICSQGVFQSVDNGLAVSAGTGLNVSVATGRAIIQEHWIKNDAALTLAIPAASSTYARIDAVVIRFSSSNRNITITVKEGTAAASPAAPAMTRTGGTYEMALAYVNVAANATSVTVTDKRSDSSVCGWAAVAQATSGEVDQMLNDMKTGFDGVEYDSPVEMVQGCDEVLQGEIDDTNNTMYLNLNGKDYQCIPSVSGYYTAANTVTDHSSFKHCELMVTKSLNKISITFTETLDSNFICAIILDENKNEIVRIVGSQSGNTRSINLTTCPTAKYIQLNYFGSYYYPYIFLEYSGYVKDDNDYVTAELTKNYPVTVGGHGFVYYTGAITASNDFVYTQPIYLNANEKIVVSARGYLTDIAIISKCNSDGTGIVPQVLSIDSTVREYTFESATSCYVMVCANISDLSIYKAVYKASVLYDIAKTGEIIYGYWCGPSGITAATKCAYVKCEIPANTSYISILNPAHDSSQSEVNSAYEGTAVFLDSESSQVSVLRPENYVAGPTDGKYYASFPVPNGSTYVCFSVKLTGMDVVQSLVVIPERIIEYPNVGIQSINGMGMCDAEARKKINSLASYTQVYDWSDKTWLLVGDSLTEKNLRAAISYYDYIAEATGVNLINKGSSGLGYFKSDWFYTAIGRVSSDDFDFCTFFGSGNDLSYETVWTDGRTWAEALGNVTDNGTNSICGYINRTFDRFNELHPLKKMGVVTPTPWAEYVGNTGVITGNRMDDYSNALVQICQMRGIPCLDLFHESGLRPWIESFRVEYYKENGIQDNGVHPNSKGHKWIYPMFFQFLKQFLVD